MEDVALDDDGEEYSHHQCAICLLDYEDGDEISWSQNKQCEHMFHRDCVYRWLLKHNECPYCRRPYLTDDNENNGEEEAAAAEEGAATDPEACVTPSSSTNEEDAVRVAPPMVQVEI